MPIFNYFIDRKFTAWERDHYSIEATTQDEADKIILDRFHHPEVDSGIEPHFYEDIPDTREDLLHEENDNQSTRELFRLTEGGKETMIADNSFQNPT